MSTATLYVSGIWANLHLRAMSMTPREGRRHILCCRDRVMNLVLGSASHAKSGPWLAMCLDEPGTRQNLQFRAMEVAVRDGRDRRGGCRSLGWSRRGLGLDCDNLDLARGRHAPRLSTMAVTVRVRIRCHGPGNSELCAPRMAILNTGLGVAVGHSGDNRRMVVLSRCASNMGPRANGPGCRGDSAGTHDSQQPAKGRSPNR